jgi:hypothetical protein
MALRIDTLMWMPADISCLEDISRKFFDCQEVWWCLTKDFAGIMHVRHVSCHVLMYSWCYDYTRKAGYSTNCPFLKLFKTGKIDIQDSACPCVVCILQHPRSCPTARSTQDTMVNAPNINFCQFQLENTVIPLSSPYIDVIKWTMTIVVCC